MQVRWWQNSRLCRYYAVAAAVLLILLAVIGYVTYPFGWDHLAHFYHLLLGILFGYTGFFMADDELVRQVVGGLGVLLLAVKVLTLAALWVSDENSLWGPLEVTCFVVGITSILAARYLRDPTSQPGG